MTEIAFLTHVFNAQSAVENHLSNFRAMDAADLERLEFLVVDDCSDQPLAVEHDDLPVRTFRITTDIPWNMAGAKNLLRNQAKAPWLLFFDIDNLLPASEIKTLITSLGSLNEQTVYMFQRIYDDVNVDSHINTFLIHRNVLNAVGGFDEDFCGHYGYEDVFFHHLLVQKGVDRILLMDLTFVQGSARTETLNRDMERNNILTQKKVASKEGTSERQLRFEWVLLD